MKHVSTLTSMSQNVTNKEFATRQINFLSKTSCAKKEKKTTTTTNHPPKLSIKSSK